MHPPLRGSGRSALALLLVVLGCGDSPTAIERQSSPFYYHLDTPIHLRADDREMSIATRTRDAAAVTELLADADLPVESLEPRPQVTSSPHWIVRVRSPRDMEAVARNLWNRADVLFASPVYHTTEGDSRVEVLNELLIEAVEGASRREVERMADGLDLILLEAERGPRDDQYKFALPTRSGFTALEIAAAVHRHAVVEWASPNFISAIGPSTRKGQVSLTPYVGGSGWGVTAGIRVLH